MKSDSEYMRIGSWGLIFLFVIRRHDDQTHYPSLILVTSYFNHKIGFYLTSIVWTKRNQEEEKFPLLFWEESYN